MLKRATGFFLCTFLFAGCASPYTGPEPNFSLRGKAAEQEAEQFKLNDNFWDQAYYFEMGPGHNKYTVSSLQPIMEKVSPSAAAKTHKAGILSEAAVASLGIAIAALLGIHTTSDVKTQSALTTAFFIGDGTALGLAIYRDIELNSAAKEYNQDLRHKLTPTVGMNFQF